ncbi:MAG TPA: hypothetical protein VGK67_00955 [Myxococcales bacterium]
MRLALTLLLAAGLALPGCASRLALAPGPGAQAVADDPFAATAEVGGLRATVEGRWKGEPPSLGDYVTPVRVTLENRSGAPVRLRYQDFTLTSRNGVTAHALPPFKIQRAGFGGAYAVAPFWPHEHFWLAPPYGPYYPGWALWTGPFAWDYPYYELYFGRWELSLPTRDMLQKAMPEGVLEGGGKATGYLYFQRVQGEPGTEVQFRIHLVDANTEAEIGRLVIPMVVKPAP